MNFLLIIEFELIEKKFVMLLSSIVSASNHTKWLSLSNNKFITVCNLFR